MAVPPDLARMLANLRGLAALTATDRGAQRVAWTDTWAQARRLLRAQLAELPVVVEIDEAGNLWARLQGASPHELIIGSHIDSVRTAAGSTAASASSRRSRCCAAWPAGQSRRCQSASWIGRTRRVPASGSA